MPVGLYKFFQKITNFVSLKLTKRKTLYISFDIHIL